MARSKTFSTFKGVVALGVAGVTERTLQAADTTRSANRPTTDLAAYDLNLRTYAIARSSSGRVPRAFCLLEQAIDRDLHYGLRPITVKLLPSVLKETSCGNSELGIHGSALPQAMAEATRSTLLLGVWG
jgi:hypothetical protein